MTWYLSGGADNDDPTASLGGVISSEPVADTLNGLFDDVNSPETAAGDVEYRCLFWKNESGGLLENVHVYVVAQPSGDDSFKVGKDLAGNSAAADTIADEDTAPDPAVTFVSAADYDNGVDIGDVDDDEYYGIWVERTVPEESSAGTSEWTIRARGETAA